MTDHVPCIDDDVKVWKGQINRKAGTGDQEKGIEAWEVENLKRGARKQDRKRQANTKNESWTKLKE